MNMRVLLVGIFVAALTAPAFAADGQPASGFQFDDLQKLVSFGSPQFSPDGRQIAVIVSRPDWKTDKTKSEIDLVDVASGASRTLTWNREGLGSPRWSPDGSRLAFLAKDADSKQAQIFVLPMNGGDAVRITDSKQGVDEFTWSPDGKWIAFISQDPPVNEKAIKAHNDVFRVTDGNFLIRAALAPWHLWKLAAGGGKPQRLTQGDFSLQTDQGGASPLVWSHDGKRIVFTRFPSPYWGPSFHAVIAEVAADGGTPQTLVSAQGTGAFAYVPGGNDFAFMRPRNGDQNNGNAVYVHAYGKTRDASAALARNFNSFDWLPGGRALLLSGEYGTHSVLWEQPLQGAARQLDLGAVDIGSEPSVSGSGAVAFVGSTATHPDELYVMDSVTAKPRRLTDLNAFVDKLTLGRTETVNWKGPDGFSEDGVLTYPVGYRQGRKYPLVLVIHGGPEGASGVHFSPLPQLLATAGFLVFQPNYRGSINLGDKYQHAIYRDTGAGPDKDVMAGLAAVEKLGMVDSSRIGVSGWSYGGYMTTWLSGHHRIWKAAVSGAALTDWVMDYTVAYYQTGDLYFFGGSPWTEKYWDIWREQSPITYARNVTAPTLIMGDVGDSNVPLLNSYEWYHALRDNGVEVQFYAYPADTHFPHDIVRTTDVYRRWVGWMVQYLK
ncbi:MAG TPA: S9 family peptidase [Gammaproteobacteria bacterium]|nr:S9 family peptidase [Gammaproteobacteria bacterium]